MQMIAHKPENRLESIDDILNSDWMTELDNLSSEEKKALEQKAKDKLEEIYEFIKDKNKVIKYANILIKRKYNTRSGSNEKEESKKTPKNIPNDRININNYIIIDGDLPENKFMNKLIEDIKSEFGIIKIDINPHEEYEHLKFELCFYDFEKKDKIKKEEEDVDKDKKCVMEIELFQYEDGRYLLEFLRKKGKIPDYYDYFLEIKKIIEEKTLKSL